MLQNALWRSKFLRKMKSRACWFLQTRKSTLLALVLDFGTLKWGGKCRKKISDRTVNIKFRGEGVLNSDKPLMEGLVVPSSVTLPMNLCILYFLFCLVSGWHILEKHHSFEEANPWKPFHLDVVLNKSSAPDLRERWWCVSIFCSLCALTAFVTWKQTHKPHYSSLLSSERHWDLQRT